MSSFQQKLQDMQTNKKHDPHSSTETVWVFPYIWLSEDFKEAIINILKELKETLYKKLKSFNE